MNTDPQSSDDASPSDDAIPAPAEKTPAENILTADAYATAMPGDEFSTTGVRAILAASKPPASSSGSLPGTSSESPPRQRLGNYELIRPIGHGAMGDVYLAQHCQFTRRKYAIKLIRRERTSSKAKLRFEREIAALSGLAHPNLVFASDAGIESSQMYLVMEYIAGQDLQQIIDRDHRLPVGVVAEILRQVALGLHHAHQHDIVHRDIKPANLMLTDGGEVKVLDLGVASLQGDVSRMTRDGDVMGTAAFLAPELWHNAKHASPQSDLYALACTAYSLLTGSPPFHSMGGASMAEMLLQHQDQTPPSLTRLRAGIADELAILIQHNLAKSPLDRSESALEFAKHIEPFCEPIPARPVEQDSQRSGEDRHHVAADEPRRVDEDTQPLLDTEEEQAHASNSENESESDGQRWTRNESQPKPIRSRIYAVVITLGMIATVGLTLAYFGPLSTPTWQLRFDRLGDPQGTRGLGFAIELFRVWLYVGLTVALMGMQFTREVRSFFDPRIWKPSVVMMRLAILAVILLFVVAEGTRQLTVSKAPTALAQWGIEQGIVTTPQTEANPYRPYLAYSLVNYIIVMGASFSFPMIRFWFSDLRYILLQLQMFQKRQSVQIDGSRLTANLHRFGTELRALTGRYISVLGVLAIGAHYDYWIGSLTLTEEGQNTMLMGMAVACLAALFVIVIAYLFFRGFDCTGRRIASVGTISDESDLSRVSLVWFMKTTLLYNLGGLACLSLVVLIAHAFFS